MTRLSANASLLLAAALWGFGNVCQKTVLDDLGPFTTVGFRCLIGLLIILPLLSQERIARQRSSRPSLKLLALISLLFAGGMVTQQASFASTTVTNGSFLITTTTVFTPLVAWLLHRLWPSPVIWMAIVGCLIGTFLMAGGQWSSVATGDILCLISAMIYSVWFVVLGDAVVRHGRPILITVSQFLGAGLLSNRMFLKDLLGSAIDMPETAWRNLTWRWVIASVGSVEAGSCGNTVVPRIGVLLVLCSAPAVRLFVATIASAPAEDRNFSVEVVATLPVGTITNGRSSRPKLLESFHWLPSL